MYIFIESSYIVKIGNNKISSKLTSYEIVCAAARRAPKNAYLEFLVHPASIIA